MAIQSFIDQVDLFTAGRSCLGPLKVVLHQYQSGLEMLDLQMQTCPRPRPAQSPGCHTSFHYGVDGCKVHQYVDLANTAWGFYVIPPPCPEPPCPVIQTCDGIGADQYNTLPDGSAVTPPPLTGTDGTPNCQVIHVAVVRGINAQGESIFCFDSPLFDPKAYDCLVNSLCQIFDAAGLVPDAETNLLVHIGELIGLDTVQLALDIIACQEAPGPVLPECDCTPAVLDSTSINFSVTGSNEITGTAIISPDAGNQLTNPGNGLFVPSSDNFTVLVLTQTGATIDPALADVFVYNGTLADETKNVLTPVAGGRNNIWVKNISDFNLELTFAAVNGVDNAPGASIILEPQSVGAYPFGNDGGEAAQLVYVAALDTWVVV